jgi:hypothetical protein
MLWGCDMMGGANAFVIQAVNEMAVREHELNEKRQRGRPPRARGLPTRAVAEVVAAIVASAVIALMVAAGGLAEVAVTDEGCLIGESGACTPPDVLTICTEVGGRRHCIKEPT